MTVVRRVDVGTPIQNVLVADDHVVVYGEGALVFRRGDTEPTWRTDEVAYEAAFGPPRPDDDRMLYLATESPNEGLAVTALVLGDDGVDERFRRTIRADSVASLLPTGTALLVGSGGTDLFVLDPDSGDKLVTLNGRHAGTLDGRLATTTYGEVRSYSALDDRLAEADVDWTVDRPELRGRPLHPALADGRTLVGSFGIPGERDGHLHCFDAETGDPCWEPRSFGWATWTPAVDGDVGYVAGSPGTGRVAAIDLDDGSTLWHHETDLEPIEPVVGGDVVVVRHDDTPGSVRAFDADTGEILWTFETEGYASAVHPVGENVYLTAGNTLFVLK